MLILFSIRCHLAPHGLIFNLMSCVICFFSSTAEPEAPHVQSHHGSVISESKTFVSSFPNCTVITRELLWFCTSCVKKKITQWNRRCPFDFSSPAASWAVNTDKVQPGGGNWAALTTSSGTWKEAAAAAAGAHGCTATEEQRRLGLMTQFRSMIRQIALESSVWFHSAPRSRPALRLITLSCL